MRRFGVFVNPVEIILKICIWVFMIFSSGHALLNKRDPRAALGWVVICFLFSGGGSILYWIFGVNRIRTHAQKMRRIGRWQHQTPIDRSTLKSSMSIFKSQKYLRSFLELSQKISQKPLLDSNHITILYNGDQAYTAMIKAINQSKKFVYLCTYIYDFDSTGQKFFEVIQAAFIRGVKIRILLDAIGEMYSYPHVRKIFKKSKIPVAQFLPFSLSLNRLHPNLRNHRKILVVDGYSGFTGGMNISDRHMVQSQENSKCVEDVHFEFNGPIVKEMEEIFISDWYFSTGESLPWEDWGSKVSTRGIVCRAINDGPDENFEKLNHIISGIFSSAKKSIKIVTPYFVPDRILISNINIAILRGINVEIIVPERSNLPYVDWASRALLWEILAQGAKVYFYPKSFIHSKVLIMDDLYVLIGSGNFDSRSFRLNFEFNVEIYDFKIASQLTAYFNAVKEGSKPVVLKDVQSFPLIARLRNSLAKLASPYF